MPDIGLDALHTLSYLILDCAVKNKVSPPFTHVQSEAQKG